VAALFKRLEVELRKMTRISEPEERSQLAIFIFRFHSRAQERRLTFHNRVLFPDKTKPAGCSADRKGRGTPALASGQN
ncbi:hypothetical protein CDAR_223541, partial [Caerostris darwini]